MLFQHALFQHALFHLLCAVFQLFRPHVSLFLHLHVLFYHSLELQQPLKLFFFYQALNQIRQQDVVHQKHLRHLFQVLSHVSFFSQQQQIYCVHVKSFVLRALVQNYCAVLMVFFRHSFVITFLC